MNKPESNTTLVDGCLKHYLVLMGAPLIHTTAQSFAFKSKCIYPPVMNIPLTTA